MGFAPCYAPNAVSRTMMSSDGVSSSGKTEEGEISESTPIFHAHLRMYMDRAKLRQCRVAECNDKGHHVAVDGIEISERSDHIKKRLQTGAFETEGDRATTAIRCAYSTSPAPSSTSDSASERRRTSPISCSRNEIHNPFRHPNNIPVFECASPSEISSP